MVDGEKWPIALSFDDVLLLPGYSEVLPSQVDVSSRLTRHIRLNIPILSAAMDMVTEAALAIALAREGGIGVIHRNMTIERQATEVDKVKRSESGMIIDPVTLSPEATVREALALMARAKLFLHQGQAVTSVSAPISLTSSMRWAAAHAANSGKASFVPRPAPQQKAFSRILGISTNSTAGMALRISLGWA